MKIWLINPYGPIPSESWRDYCFTMLARALTRAGHDVVWWTSSFSHHFKRQRSEGWSDQATADGFTIRLVPSPGYQRNIGTGRIWRDWVFALRCWRAGRREAAPDCVVFSENPLTLGFAGHRLARHFRCLAIHHQMDLWPELMVNAAPAGLKGLLNAALWPIYQQRRRMFQTLDAATGLAEPYLALALSEAPVLRDRPHAVVYNGIHVRQFRAWMDEGTALPGSVPVKQAGETWAVFAGSLGPSYDIPAMCQVATRLAEQGSSLRLIIAGDGPLRPMVEATAAGPSGTHLSYVGKLKPKELAALYGRCDIGLCAYSPASNVEMPDKIYDYTAAGLAVVNSLRGEVARVIERQAIGLPYPGGDADALLRQLQALEADAPRLAAMKAASHALGSEYDEEVQYGRMVALIEAVGAASGRHSPPMEGSVVAI